MPEAVLLEFVLRGEFRDKYPHQLVARFPHVARHMESVWNDEQAIADYFSELMIPKRPNRKGFPPDVATEIMQLSLAYDKIGKVGEISESGVAPSTVEQYQWERERLISDIDALGYPFTGVGFSRAIEAADDKACLLFLRAGFSLESRDARHWTPLMAASFYGREQIATQLIKLGADVFATDSSGYSSLHWAAFSGFADVVRLLLRSGISATVISHAGISPLLQASARGHVEVVEILLAHRGDPNLQANDGSTPLTKAVANQHLPIVLLLLNAGAYRNITLKNGTTMEDILAKVRDPRIRALMQ